MTRKEANTVNEGDKVICNGRLVVVQEVIPQWGEVEWFQVWDDENEKSYEVARTAVFIPN